MRKTKWITSLAAFVLVSIACVQFSGYNAKQKYVEVSKGLSVPVGNCVISEWEADVDSDGKPDKIYVYGEKKNKEDDYAERINLAVVYAKNGFVKKTNVSHIKGYVGGVEVRDFTDNKNNDVLLKIYTDADKSVMSAFIADFGQEIPKNIMGDSRGINPDFSFAKGWILNCSLSNGQQFSVNLEKKKQILIEKGIFDEVGELLKNEKVYAKYFCDINALDYDGDSQYELEGVQKVVAGQDETELFKMHSVQKFSGKTWGLVKIEVKY